MTDWSNKAGSVLTEESLERALTEIRRLNEKFATKISLTPTHWLKPPGMTMEEFERWRKRALAAAAPEIRRAYGCE